MLRALVLPEQAVRELRPWMLRPARTRYIRPVALLLFALAFLVTGRAY